MVLPIMLHERAPATCCVVAIGAGEVVELEASLPIEVGLGNDIDLLGSAKVVEVEDEVASTDAAAVAASVVDVDDIVVVAAAAGGTGGFGQTIGAQHPLGSMNSTQGSPKAGSCGQTMGAHLISPSLWQVQMAMHSSLYDSPTLRERDLPLQTILLLYPITLANREPLMLVAVASCCLLVAEVEVVVVGFEVVAVAAAVAVTVAASAGVVIVASCCRCFGCTCGCNVRCCCCGSEA